MTTHIPAYSLAHRHEDAQNAYLDSLEAEAVHILREVAASCERPALLFSGGKDSCALLRLAVKAFAPADMPFPLLHIDTGHNFPEVIAFRDALVQRYGFQLIVGHVEDSIAAGSVVLPHPLASRNAAQAITLLEAIAEHRFGCLMGGARRDEEKARAKERIFSHRDSFGQWQPKMQRPELWDLYATKLNIGEHFRAFPISNWTELDVWRYIAREGIELPSLYFAHEREVFARRGLWVPHTHLSPPQQGETVIKKSVRFRTVGDMSCTCPVESTANDFAEIIAETIASTVSERGATRLDDQTAEAAMEQRKKEGYF